MKPVMFGLLANSHSKKLEEAPERPGGVPMSRADAGKLRLEGAARAEDTLSGLQSTARERPIRPGMQYIDSKRRTWEVYEIKPGGVVELFCQSGSLFNRTYTRCVREWISAGTFTEVAR